MNRFQLMNLCGNLGCSGKKLVQAVALALMLVMALPAMASEARVVKSRVSPVYPEIAKRMRVSGMVKLEAAVDAQGKVTEVKEVSGNHTLALAAREALLHWKFAPADSDTNETVEINFDLEIEILPPQYWMGWARKPVRPFPSGDWDDPARAEDPRRGISAVWAELSALLTQEKQHLSQQSIARKGKMNEP